ncbi:ATPase family associated with various cellular activities (AAA) [Nocardia amikacinitolerans]|nr:ATP-binding protein [Nocardia amikacinitolerans]MCP2319688.1 ATPase family associated with various cellular activities (AAA) [Nocardia amikacinitolerans]
MTDDPVLVEMLAALDRSPDVLALRLRVIELLAERGRHAEALAQCGAALTQEPGNARAVELLQQCTAALAGGAAAAPASANVASGSAGSPSAASSFGETDATAPGATRTAGHNAASPAFGGPANAAPGAAEATDPDVAVTDGISGDAAPAAGPLADGQASNVEPAPPSNPESVAAYDWDAAEDQVSDIIAPAFIDPGPAEYAASSDAGLFSRTRVTLADVGGMDEVKRQLDLTLLGPLRNPELAKAFGTSARGGLLLYGPPGCGKTFIASAVAGELGANFYPIEIADILDIYTGSSERNLHSVFEVARRNAPCVLFLDEVDALGHKRSQMSGNSAMRTVVNQLLNEMDSATVDNEGVYILGATNHPWDIDVALRRPGRFDRMILVALPDPAARKAILHYHLRERPVAGIDLGAIAARTEGFSGADLAHVCTSATQLAMAESIRTGTVRPIGMADLEAAMAQIKPSAGAWFESARNVVEFANGDGSYDELAMYMKRMKMR